MRAFSGKGYADTIMPITVLVPGLVAYTEKGAVRARMGTNLGQACLVDGDRDQRLGAGEPEGEKHHR
jgi:hypothetical protein